MNFLYNKFGKLHLTVNKFISSVHQEENRFITLIGRWKDNKLNGFAVKEYMKRLYTGEYHKNICEGYGLLYNEYKQIVYEGEWSDNQKNGIGITLEKNMIFKGEHKNNFKHGLGILVKKTQKYTYEGEFKKDHFNGYGCLLNDNRFYLGHFKGGYFEGYGKTFLVNQMCMKSQGHFSNGELEGFGVKCLEEGKRFEGEFHENEPNGYGTYYINNEKIVVGCFGRTNEIEAKVTNIDSSKYVGSLNKRLDYEGIGFLSQGKDCCYYGEFYDGKVHGIAVLVLNSLNTFVGSCSNGNPNGYGTVLYKNGDLSFGRFRNGKISGFSKIEFINGDLFEGEFLDNVTIIGILHEENSTYEGQFIQGMLKHGYGILTTENGVYEGQFENNKIKGVGRVKLVEENVWIEGFWSIDNEKIKRLLNNWKFEL